jgi:hypothetical protein
MGHVWRAEHTKLKTAVAVKLIAPSMVQSAEARARFDREARVAASLDSPNVVRITDFGVEDDTPFIVMELLEGETLGARLAGGALSPEATLRVFSQIARGISRAHQARVVHCDLKPENVFLAHVDGEEVAKIVDFGVAKAPLLDPLTQTGAVLGTLQYMSPEQLEGRKNVGERSDLYSLAVIVFECICGQPAFRGDSIAELVRRICGAPLPMPSKIAKVPPGFDAWFARAAHRDPAARFGSAREMSDALVAAFERASSHSAVAVSVSAAPRVVLAATVASLKGGDASAGYRITPDTSSRVMEVELWGMFDVRLAQAARQAFVDAFELMRPSGKWVAIGFGTRHPPQNQAVQEIMGATMALAAPAGMLRMAFVIGSALAKMSARRLANESDMGKTRFFEDEASARAWIAEALAPSRSGGTSTAGYRVTCDERARFMHVELWGMHDVALAREARDVLLEAQQTMKPGGAWVAIGTGAHPPQRPEVQALETESMAAATRNGMARIAFLLPDGLATMNVRRLTAEIKMPNARFFNDEEEAKLWLAEPLLPERRGGDERAGFAIRAQPKARILHLEFWGMWDMNVARAFRKEVLASYAEMGKGPWDILSNARRYLPQKDEIQAIHKETMAAARGLSRVAALVDAAVSQMQIRRMFIEAGSPPNLRFFTDEDDAREWLAEARGLAERRGGDESAGFRITPDSSARIVEIERWGVWTVAIASDFKKQILEVCEVMKTAPWAGLSFATRHPPQSAEVQRLQGDTMAVARSYGCVRAAMIAESALAAMMIRRLTQENHMDVARVFTTEREARAWLAEGGFGTKR